MKRQVFQTDRKTGKVIHYYVECGPKKAVPIDKISSLIKGVSP